MDYITLEEFNNIYQSTIGETNFSLVEKSYNNWKDSQERYHSKEGAELREKHGKVLIWNDHSTAESWINNVKSNIEHDKAMDKAQREYFALPWYERELQGSPIKDIMIDAFIKDEKGMGESRRNQSL